MKFGTKSSLLKSKFSKKFDNAKQAFRQGVSEVDKSYRTIDRAGSRVFSGVRARMPRIVPTSNSSREVLNDAFKLDTDITRRRQF